MARGPVLAMLLMPLLGGCVLAGGASEQPVAVLLQGAHCGAERAQARWVPAGQLPPEAEEPPSTRAEQPVLLLSMGERPTAGYALALAEPVLAIGGGVAALRVQWREPAPGGMTAQVITRPCLALSVPAAAFERLEVVDEQGAVRWEVAPPP